MASHATILSLPNPFILCFFFIVSGADAPSRRDLKTLIFVFFFSDGPWEWLSLRPENADSSVCSQMTIMVFKMLLNQGKSG